MTQPMTQPITQPITQPPPRKIRSASSIYYGVCQPANQVAKDNWLTHITIGVDMVYLGTHDSQLMAALHWDVANMMIYGPDCLHHNTGIGYRSAVPMIVETLQRQVIRSFLRPKGQRVLEKNPRIKAALQRWIDARDAEQDERFNALPALAPITPPALLDGVTRVASTAPKYSTDDILYDIPGRPGGMRATTTTTTTSAKPCINVHYVVGPQGVERMESIKPIIEFLAYRPGARPSLWRRLKDIVVRLWRDEY